MVAISFDRFFNVAYPRKFPILTHSWFQFTLIAIIVTYNYAYYSFITWNTSLQVSIGLNGTQITTCVGNFDYSMLNWMDLFNSTVVPFSFMIVLSVLVIVLLVRSRSRVRSESSQTPRLSQRSRKFAMTIVFLNLVFLLLNLPVVIMNLIVPPNAADNLYYFFVSLYYLNTGISFYVQLTVNSLFRQQLLTLLGLRVASAQENLELVGSISATVYSTKMNARSLS
jgi:hypothetical protein